MIVILLTVAATTALIAATAVHEFRARKERDEDRAYHVCRQCGYRTHASRGVMTGYGFVCDNCRS